MRGGLPQRLSELRRGRGAPATLHRPGLQSSPVALGSRLPLASAVRTEMELGRRVHCFASTRSAGRRAASRVGLGSRFNNAFRSALRRREGRRRKAVYSVGGTELDAAYGLVQFSGTQVSSPKGSLQIPLKTGSMFRSEQQPST